MQQGYVKLFRCLLGSTWAKQPDFVAVWVFCLLRANYKETNITTKGGANVVLKAGQFLTSRQQISLSTGVQESKVERILKVFKSEQQIEQRNCGIFRIISILNWSRYQESEQDIEQHLNNNRTTFEQQLNTDKKVKKEKKETKGEMLPLCKAWKSYVEMRMKIKKPMTENAQELAVKKLIALQALGNNPLVVLEQSVFSSWLGLFAVKGDLPAAANDTVIPSTTNEDRERLKKAMAKYD